MTWPAFNQACNGQRVELKTVEMETRIKQMQVYDQLRELDIEENEKSLR